MADRWRVADLAAHSKELHRLQALDEAELAEREKARRRARGVHTRQTGIDNKHNYDVDAPFQSRVEDYFESARIATLSYEAVRQVCPYSLRVV
jgi:hypothetical protein